MRKSERAASTNTFKHCCTHAQVRRRAQAQAQQQQQQQQQYNLENARSYCTSEPRLSETETPPQRRKLSQRRPQPHGKFAKYRNKNE
ncbi:unnamed protein product [Ceratitis capitata]|uniref:(Mediterranean fruit fly) hypothetical protein n=1 Tax=Ceratitis capitata TaxID=7213 RepID=A0A811VIT7_CERCA|nr:unnamed protein product [Ceratitis capitata]